MATELEYCVGYLAAERFGKEAGRRFVEDNAQSQQMLFDAYRDLVNVREAAPVSDAFLAAQDAMLRAIISQKGITDAEKLDRVRADARLSIWRGDITTLRADAIVNAANEKMLGCWVPRHYCIDNAIHSFAGVQLRAECDRLMKEQGFAEPTGRAKVTPAYNLPCRWIIHTVGPIANGTASSADCRMLASCYTSCLSAAREAGAKSIAFCCISTGAFGFPQEQAAPIAVSTVREWLDAEHSDLHIIFNVFNASDEKLYRALLDR